MSRKLNSSFDKSVASPKNNLFNYFSRSPAIEKKKIPRTPAADEKPPEEVKDKKLKEKENLAIRNKSPTKEKTSIEKKNQLLDSDEEEIVTTTKKRRRLLLQDSDSEEEANTNGKQKDSDSSYEPEEDEEMPSESDEKKSEARKETESSPKVRKSKVMQKQHFVGYRIKKKRIFLFLFR